MEKGRQRRQKRQRLAVVEDKAAADQRRLRTLAAEPKRRSRVLGPGAQQIVEATHGGPGRVAHHVRVTVRQDDQVACLDSNRSSGARNLEPAAATLDEVKRRDLSPAHAEPPWCRQLGAAEYRATKAYGSEHVTQEVGSVVGVEPVHSVFRGSPSSQVDDAPTVASTLDRGVTPAMVAL